MNWWLAIALFCSAALAEEPPSADLIETQAALERTLSLRYEKMLLTVLEHDSFKVGVMVSLQKVELPPEERQTAPAPAPTANPAAQYPGDLGLGIVERMDDAYLRRILPTQPQATPTPYRPPPSYKVQSVLVQVGLHPNLNKRVPMIVERWLQSRLKAEFGQKAVIEVSFLVRPKAEPPPTPAPGCLRPRPPAALPAG